MFDKCLKKKNMLKLFLNIHRLAVDNWPLSNEMFCTASKNPDQLVHSTGFHRCPKRNIVSDTISHVSGCCFHPFLTWTKI